VVVKGGKEGNEAGWQDVRRRTSVSQKEGQTQGQRPAVVSRREVKTRARPPQRRRAAGRRRRRPVLRGTKEPLCPPYPIPILFLDGLTAGAVAG
jgi:hypothetical protein